MLKEEVDTEDWSTKALKHRDSRQQSQAFSIDGLMNITSNKMLISLAQGLVDSQEPAKFMRTFSCDSSHKQLLCRKKYDARLKRAADKATKHVFYLLDLPWLYQSPPQQTS